MADVAWGELLKLHERLQEERSADKLSRQSQITDTTVSNADGTHDRIRLLVARAKRYEAERKILYHQKANFGTATAAEVACSAHHELEEVLRSSTEASEQLSVRLQQAGVDLERELRNVKPRAYGRIGEAIQLNVYDCNLQGLNDQQKKLQAALESKLAAARALHARDDGSGRGGSHTADLRRRVRHASQQNQALLTSMGAFIADHFPELRASDVAAAQGAATSKDTLGRYQTTDFISFMSLLEDLMNQCVASPENPYIVIDAKKHWQPYIEFILRWGIGVKDPSSPNRIKLTEYHI